MLNAIQRTGMGFTLGIHEDDHLFDYPGDYEVYSMPPMTTSPPIANSASGPDWWAILGPGIIQTTRDIFAPVGTSQAAYGAQYTRTNQQSLSNDQLALLRAQGLYNPTGNVGSQVERFITDNWILIAVVAGVLFFPGFTRRR